MKDDNIYLVQEESILEEPYARDGFGLQFFPQFIRHKRVIPFPAEAKSMFYLGKAKRKDVVRVHFEIETGLVLRYGKRKWKDEHNIEIDIPLKDAERLARSILKTTKRFSRLALEERSPK